MSDDLQTIIAGMYGHPVSAHAHFFLNDKEVPHHSLVDEHQGQTLHIKYHEPADKSFQIDPSWVTSIEIPQGFAV
jgi:hypothetical protein